MQIDLDGLVRLNLAQSNQAPSLSNISAIIKEHSPWLTPAEVISAATPTTGTYTETATYNGNTYYSALTTTSPISTVVTKATPIISVVATPASPVLGGTITYTATVTGVVGATAPAGTITWTVSGAASSCNSTAGGTAGGQANQTVFTCVVNANPAGTYTATATYSGDTNYTSLAATSPLNVVISKVVPTVTLASSGRA